MAKQTKSDERKLFEACEKAFPKLDKLKGIHIVRLFKGATTTYVVFFSTGELISVDEQQTSGLNESPVYSAYYAEGFGKFVPKQATYEIGQKMKGR